MTTTQDSGDRVELNHGALGTPSIVFMVMATVAPIGAVGSAMALGIALGNGPGIPGAYLIAGIVLILFAAGFAAMSHHVTNAGAFYTYVARGLGRPAGLGAAFMALIAYNAIFCSVTGAFGYFAQVVFADLGLDLPWGVWAAIALVLVALLGRRQIDLNAKVLGVLLTLEVAVILVLDIAILVNRGPGEFPVTSFSPSTVLAAGLGVGLVAAFNSFIGFESTAIFGEEARNPRRTIPRATFVSVGTIAVFYALTAWALVAAYGSDKVQSVAAEDPGTFVLATIGQFVDPIAADITALLLVTSLFAAVLATHNATARYFFAMGRERVLPGVLGKVHPKLRSPYVASGAQVGLAVIVIGAFVLAGADPLVSLSTSMGGLGTVGLITLQALAALAVVVFFRKRGDRRLFTTVIAPALGCLGLATATVVVLNNFSILTGVESGLINWLPVLVLLAGVGGVGYALWLRSAKPDRYAGMAGLTGEEQELQELEELEAAAS